MPRAGFLAVIPAPPSRHEIGVMCCCHLPQLPYHAPHRVLAPRPPSRTEIGEWLVGLLAVRVWVVAIFRNFHTPFTFHPLPIPHAGFLAIAC